MARKSRKNIDLREVIVAETTPTIYRTAIYARLSKEDERIGNDCSIDTQIDLIRQFIAEKPYLQIQEIYADNGFTGTNFERTSFIKMMEDIKKGNVDCVVVKDLSRFGRNYIEVSNYIEIVFPFLNVRFISVNDSFDTFSPDMDRDMMVMQLKMIMHDYYSKNLSHSVKSVCDKKRDEGLYLGCHAHYGYKKDPQNKYKLIVNEETDSIVKQIFEWKLEGISCSQIAERLNKADVPTPKAYLYSKGLVWHEKFAKKIYWQSCNLKRILANQVYIGNLAQGNERVSFGKRTMNKTPTWVAYGTHEALIQKSDFDKIQVMLEETKEKSLSQRGKCKHEKTPNMFRGLIFCEHCGKSLPRLSKPLKTGLKYSFYCTICSKYEGLKPVSISETSLLDCLNQTISNEIKAFIDLQKLVLSLQKSSEVNGKVENNSKKIVLTKQSITKKENLLKELYEDLTSAILTKEEYNFAKTQYLKDYEALQQHLAELVSESETYKNNFVADNKFVRVVDSFKNDFTVNAQILNALIERITINSEKEVTIKYNFQDEYKSLINFAKKNGGAINE